MSALKQNKTLWFFCPELLYSRNLGIFVLVFPFPPVTRTYCLTLNLRAKSLDGGLIYPVSKWNMRDGAACTHILAVIFLTLVAVIPHKWLLCFSLDVIWVYLLSLMLLLFIKEIIKVTQLLDFPAFGNDFCKSQRTTYFPDWGTNKSKARWWWTLKNRRPFKSKTHSRLRLSCSK